ncbi:hypothetical protein ACBR40_45540 [Nonomuraea sp. AD125B]|uniref:hypothetical protein n=1 Tax=Nonomuraea sp. AD125B TaxID=3242897 RepID=UPI003528F68A
MSKTPGNERVAGSRLWRVVAIASIVVLAVCLVAVLVWFFADPLHLPDDLLQVLDQRASVVGMFTGMALGTAALVVSVVALRAQLRAEHAPSTPPAVSTGDVARNVRMEGNASGQGRVYQAGGDQTINER